MTFAVMAWNGSRSYDAGEEKDFFMDKFAVSMFRRISAAAFCFIFALAYMLYGSVFAQAETADSGAQEETADLQGTAEQGGLTFETTLDKKSYKDGETAVINISVTNTNDYDVTNVNVDCVPPANFSVDGQRTQIINTIAAGKTESVQFTAVVKEDESAPIVEAVASFSMQALVAALIGLVVLVVVIYIVQMFGNTGGNGPKPPKKMISCFLILALAAASFSSVQNAVVVHADEALKKNEDFRRVTVHDPSIVKDPETGTYYVFGSHRAFAKSDDLISWTAFQNNINTDYAELFKEPTKWASQGNVDPKTYNVFGNLWAPDVIWNDTMKKWCMYMSVNGDKWCSSICLLTADHIEGPYKYEGIVVYSGINNPERKTDPNDTDIYKVLGEDADLDRYKSTSFSCINAIDPCVRYDDDGKLYMSYGSWSAGIYMLELDETTGLRDYNVTYETERDVSDAYLGVKIAGGYYNSGEASYIIKSGKYYYLFMSYAALQAMGGYQMRIFRSEKITGPYVDQNGVSAIWTEAEDIKMTNYGVKIFGSYQMPGLSRIQVAQGHNSAFVDDDGKIYVIYHTRFQSETGKNEGHQVRVHQLFMNEDDWLVAAPYEYSGETLSDTAYSNDEVCMEYNFIYHEPTKFYQVVGGTQLGIVGYEDFTTNSVEFKKETIVAHRQAIINVKVTYTHEGAAKVKLHEDGTVTGDYVGTWKFTEGANAEMVLNGVTYKGMFIKQQDESENRDMRMTFTMLGDNVTVWGVQSEL